MQIRSAAANRNLAFGATDGIADVPNSVNQWRFTELFPEATYEYLNKLCIIFVRVLPHPFTQPRACEDSARFSH